MVAAHKIYLFWYICTVYNDYVSYNTHLGCLQASIFARCPYLMIMHEAIHIVHRRDIFHPTEVARYSSMMEHVSRRLATSSPKGKPSHLFFWMNHQHVHLRAFKAHNAIGVLVFARVCCWEGVEYTCYLNLGKNIQAISLMIVHFLNTWPESHKGNEQWNISGFQRYLQYCS